MAAAQEPAAKSSLHRIEFLAGHWRGTTHGEPGDGKGERNYEFVLRGKFLRGSNRTVYPAQEKNPKGEVHEDIGFFSYDRQRKRLLLRQFHVEGFVNEYVEREGARDSKTLVFETERIENIADGWRARETYKILSHDEFIEVFKLAEPQQGVRHLCGKPMEAGEVSKSSLAVRQQRSQEGNVRGIPPLRTERASVGHPASFC